MVVQLVPLRRLGAEQRAPGREQVGAFEVVLLVDQEVLLLRSHGREYAVGAVGRAEQLQSADRRPRQRVHRAQQRDLVVQRLARPGRERRRDAQQRSVGVLEDERRRGRIPGGVAARLERRADAAGRERGGVGLALDQLLAGELGDRGAVARRGVEGVVLLRRRAGQRLKPVRVVGGAPLHRPVLHRLRDRVGERGVQRLAVLERALQRAVDVLGQPVALQVRAEHVRGEHLVGRQRQVGGAERRAVGAPLGGGDVLLAGPGGHGRVDSSCDVFAGVDGPIPGAVASLAGHGAGPECNRSPRAAAWHHRLAKSTARIFRQRAKPPGPVSRSSGQRRLPQDCGGRVGALVDAGPFPG